MKNFDTIRQIEGLLFLSGSNGITIGELIKIFNIDQLTIESLLIEINQNYKKNNSAISLLKTADTYKFATHEHDAHIYKQYVKIEFDDKITNSAMETLAIIAYNQPITRFDIEEKKGVMVGHNLKMLSDRNLITVSKKDLVTRANIYITTDDFLDFIGINNLNDLPNLKTYSYEMKNSNDHNLFNEIDDFKQIKKRLMSTQNIIENQETNSFDEIDDIKINQVKLEYNEENND